MTMRKTTLGALAGLWAAAVILVFSRHTEDACLIKELIGWSGLAFLWAAALSFRPAETGRIAGRILPNFPVPAVLLAAWLIFSAISAAAGPDKARAWLFFGRRIGYAGVVFFCAHYLRGCRASWALLRTALGASVLASLYVLIQAMGWDFLRWEDMRRPPGTFANPNFTAEFLAAFFPLALLLEGPRIGTFSGKSPGSFFITVRRAARSVPWRAALIGSAILATGSRAGMAGLLAGGLAVCLAGAGTFRRVGRRRVIIVVVAAALALILFVVFSATGRERFFSGATVSLRINLWKGALEFWRERPVFGWGLGAFRFLEERIKYRMEPLTGDRYALYPHNWALNILVEQGAAGLAFFVVLLSLLLERIVRGARILLRATRPLPRFAGSAAVGCAAGAISLLISTMFCVFLERWEGGWLVALLAGTGLAAMYHPATLTRGGKIRHKAFLRTGVFAHFRIFSWIMFLAIGAVAFLYYRSEMLLVKAKQRYLRGDAASSLRLLKQAETAGIHSPVIHFQKAETLLKRGETAGAIRAWERWTSLTGTRSDDWVLLAAIRKKRGEGARARACMERAWRMEPSGDKAVAFSRFLSAPGEEEEALDILEKQMAVYPYVPLLEEYAERASAAGRAAEALERLKQLEQTRADFPGEVHAAGIMGLKGHLLYSTGESRAAIEVYLEATRQNIQSASLWNGLALSLMHADREEEAARAFQRAVRLAPRDPRYRFNSVEAAYRRGDGEWLRRNLPHLDPNALPPLQRKRLEAIRVESAVDSSVSPE
ncbi:MAG TPA: O-antigen ligase family protein [Candidatus Sumerlaeota bacterium]|nr:O-antigen ligase family protein [Candidatus Sumerlaeota bacterium]